MITSRQLRHGRFAYHATDMIGRILDRYGEWSERELAFLLDLLAEGNVVVDVGAHIGTFTVPFARKLGRRGGVLAFEPQRLVFQNLVTNVFLNDLFNVRASNLACGREPYFINLREVPGDRSHNSGGFSFPTHIRQQRSWNATPVEPLDLLLVGLRRLTLIKIDVEGFEVEVLAGAKETLRRLRPMVHCECQAESSFEYLKALAEEFDYRLFAASFEQFNPANFAGRPLSPNLPTLRDTNVLMWPPQRPLRDDLELRVVASFEQLREAPEPRRRGEANGGLRDYPPTSVTPTSTVMPSDAPSGPK